MNASQPRLRPPRRIAHPCTWAILAIGVGLRILFCATNDPRHTYDDHFHVIKIIYEERRLPRADEGWQTYQPPLYHLTGAIVYGMTRIACDALDMAPGRGHAVGRKAIQWISAACGIATLFVVCAVLRRLFPAQPSARWAALATISLLPGHIYISGMATNDSMACLWIGVSLWAVLRCFPAPDDAGAVPPTRALWAGVFAGLAMLTKHSGLAALIPILVHGALTLFRHPPPASTVLRPRMAASLMLALALAVGCYPYLRDWARFGTPVPSNYNLVEHSIRAQPPGRWQDVSFTSLRLDQLLARPWLHLDHVDSFWTQMYAGLWFDHSTALTLWRYTPWKHRFLRIWGPPQTTHEEGIARQLSWLPIDVPARQAWQGRLLYLLGLVPSALMVAGIYFAVRLAFPQPVWALILACLLINWCVPIVQTFRQPHYSSIKTAFALGSLPAMAAMVAASVRGLADRGLAWVGWATLVSLCALGAAACWHFVSLGFFPPLPGEPFDAL